MTAHNGHTDAPNNAQIREGTDDSRVCCECCEQVIPVGSPAKIDPESGVIICLDCFSDLEAVAE